jgi:mRNA interferase MazF
VIVTAQRVLGRDPRVVQIVPLTTTLRSHGTEVPIVPDDINGLAQESAAQCQHIRAVATSRIHANRGNVGPLVLAQIRDTLAALLDL